jgi:RND family efflux transporter MFP subunit
MKSELLVFRRSRGLFARVYATKVAALLILLSTCVISTAQSQQSQLVYDGFTEPKYDILVAANEIGRVENVYVTEGDLIRQGDVVAKLEDSLQAASVRISEHQSTMLGEIEAAKAEVAMHTARAQSIRELADDQMAPPTELARAEADLQLAQARHQSALETRGMRQLELERNRVQLERRKVISPDAGIVAHVFHQPGEYVTPSDPALIRLLVVDHLYAVFNVPVADLASMNVGDDTRVFLRGSQTNLNAQVFSIAPSIDGESGTVKVRCLIPNEDGLLRVGDRCTVHLNGTPKDKNSGRLRSALLPGNSSDRLQESATK